MHDHPEHLENREEKYSRIIHGEINALISAREPVHGCVLFTYPFMPCDRCFVQMAQAGIVRFVAPIETAEQAVRWGAAFAKTRSYAAQMGLEIVQYQYPIINEFQGLTPTS